MSSSHPTSSPSNRGSSSSTASGGKFACSWVFWQDHWDTVGGVATHQLVDLGEADAPKPFWGLFESSRPTEHLPLHSSLHVFRRSVKPEWEDPSNISGGHFRMMAIPSAESSAMTTNSGKLWFDLITAMVAEQLNVSADVVGCGFTLKPNRMIISLWLRTAEQAVVLQTQKDISHFISDKFTLKFIPHRSLASGEARAHVMETRKHRRTRSAPTPFISLELDEDSSDQGVLSDAVNGPSPEDAVVPPCTIVSRRKGAQLSLDHAALAGRTSSTPPPETVQVSHSSGTFTATSTRGAAGAGGGSLNGSGGGAAPAATSVPHSRSKSDTFARDVVPLNPNLSQQDRVISPPKTAAAAATAQLARHGSALQDYASQMTSASSEFGDGAAGVIMLPSSAPSPIKCWAAGWSPSLLESATKNKAQHQQPATNLFGVAEEGSTTPLGAGAPNTALPAVVLAHSREGSEGATAAAALPAGVPPMVLVASTTPPQDPRLVLAPHNMTPPAQTLQVLPVVSTAVPQPPRMRVGHNPYATAPVADPTVPHMYNPRTQQFIPVTAHGGAGGGVGPSTTMGQPSGIHAAPTGPSMYFSVGGALGGNYPHSGGGLGGLPGSGGTSAPAAVQQKPYMAGAGSADAGGLQAPPGMSAVYMPYTPFSTTTYGQSNVAPQFQVSTQPPQPPPQRSPYPTGGIGGGTASSNNNSYGGHAGYGQPPNINNNTNVYQPAGAHGGGGAVLPRAPLGGSRGGGGGGASTSFNTGGGAVSAGGKVAGSDMDSNAAGKTSQAGGGEETRSEAAAFVLKGWLYPAGLNRKERRRICFHGIDPREVAGAVFVGLGVADGAIGDGQPMPPPSRQSPPPWTPPPAAAASPAPVAVVVCARAEDAPAAGAHHLGADSHTRATWRGLVAPNLKLGGAEGPQHAAAGALTATATS